MNQWNTFLLTLWMNGTHCFTLFPFNHLPPEFGWNAFLFTGVISSPSKGTPHSENSSASFASSSLCLSPYWHYSITRRENKYPWRKEQPYCHPLADVDSRRGEQRMLHSTYSSLPGLVCILSPCMTNKKKISLSNNNKEQKKKQKTLDIIYGQLIM